MANESRIISEQKRSDTSAASANTSSVNEEHCGQKSLDAKVVDFDKLPKEKKHGAQKSLDVKGSSRDSHTFRLRGTCAFRIVLIALLALLIECSVCNCAHWQTLGLTPYCLTDEPTTITSENDQLSWDNIDVDVTNLSIYLGDDQSSSIVYAKPSITDEGTTEAYDIPLAEIQKSVDRSSIQTLHAYGSLHSLTLSFPRGSKVNEDSGEMLDGNVYPIYIDAVYLNTEVPFTFNPLRYGCLLAALLLIYALRPHARIYRLRAGDHSSFAKGVRISSVVVASLITVLIVASFPNWGQMPAQWFGIASSDTSTSDSLATDTQDEATYDDEEPSWYHSFAYDEYAELARSMAQGRLDLMEDPPSWLAQLDDPYNPGMQDTMTEETGESNKVDAAYYQGRYYVYFGVVPVLTMYLPWHLVTGGDLPNGIALLIPTILCIVAVAALLTRLCRQRFKKVSLGVWLLVFIGIVAGSGILFGLGRPTLYQVPIACGRCLLVVGLYCWYRGLSEERNGLLALGSLSITAIIGCRPQMLIALIGIIPLAYFACRKQPQQRMRVLASLFIPVVLVGICAGCYNAARFGSFFNVGANYNLAGNNMQMRGNVPERLVDGLFFYLFQPPVISTNFPFLLPAQTDASYRGMSILEPLAGGVLVTMPFLWAAFPTKALRQRAGKSIAALMIGCCIAAVVIVCFDTEASGTIGRYCQDYAIFFALAAAVGILARIDIRCGDRCACDDYDAANDTAVRYTSLSHRTIRNDYDAANDTAVRCLRAAIAATLAYTFLLFLFMHSNAGCNTAGGSSPELWEYLRQTFQFWT
jgi:hypothetical protein